jgi:anaerobic selenocysteine-containing dehydrogenase
MVAGRVGSGVVITDDTEDETWRRLAGRHIQLDIPELLAEIARLAQRPAPGADAEWPFVLSAGERRAFTANTIIRDPRWRKRDGRGALRISDADATRLGITAGDTVRLSTRRGTAEVTVEPTPRMRAGHIALPNGLGLIVHDANEARTVGVAPKRRTAECGRNRKTVRLEGADRRGCRRQRGRMRHLGKRPGSDRRRGRSHCAISRLFQNPSGK